MPELSVDVARAQHTLAGELEAFVAGVERLDDLALLAPSRCHGWAVVDVVVHVRAGLEEMLRGLTAPTDEAPTVDAATYWSDWAESAHHDDPVDAILWTRRTAGAYRRPSGAVRHLREAADALRDATLPTSDALRFQGQVLSVGDFLATWAVEVTVHHVDAAPDLAAGLPTPDALQLTRATVEALLRTSAPAGFSDLDVLLVGAGRAPARDGVRSVLG